MCIHMHVLLCAGGAHMCIFMHVLCVHMHECPGLRLMSDVFFIPPYCVYTLRRGHLLNPELINQLA